MTKLHNSRELNNYQFLKSQLSNSLLSLLLQNYLNYLLSYQQNRLHRALLDYLKGCKIDT